MKLQLQGITGMHCGLHRRLAGRAPHHPVHDVLGDNLAVA